MSSAELTVGSTAPAFSLPAFPEGTVKLSQFKGKQNVVLYFYPRDNTPGCTTEACDFRDNLARLTSADTVVLGVSTDTVASHEKFAKKFELPFPLLADETTNWRTSTACGSRSRCTAKNRWGSSGRRSSSTNRGKSPRSGEK